MTLTLQEHGQWHSQPILPYCQKHCQSQEADMFHPGGFSARVLPRAQLGLLMALLHVPHSILSPPTTTQLSRTKENTFFLNSFGLLFRRF